MALIQGSEVKYVDLIYPDVYILCQCMWLCNLVCLMVWQCDIETTHHSSMNRLESMNLKSFSTVAAVVANSASLMAPVTDESELAKLFAQCFFFVLSCCLWQSVSLHLHCTALIALHVAARVANPLTKESVAIHSMIQQQQEHITQNYVTQE